MKMETGVGRVPGSDRAKLRLSRGFPLKFSPGLSIISSALGITCLIFASQISRLGGQHFHHAAGDPSGRR
jgi:hypothetical protein